MFDHLPLHIRETVFSRVRYMDLLKTARVSQGWWTLTMASFDGFLHKKDDFLLDQVDFCNQMMPKDEPWEWWMLMEFTKSKRLYLEISDFHSLVAEGEGRLIEYFRLMGIHVKHLRVDKNESNNEGLRLPLNLDEIFPCLTSLEVDKVAVESNSTVVFPSHLTSLRFGLLRMPSTDSITLKTFELTVLDLKECGFRSFCLLDAFKFENLTRLSVSAGGSFDMALLPEFVRVLKKVLLENKTLKSVSILYAYITKEWLKVFPANVVEIKLFKPRLKRDLVKAFGNNVFYERLLLLYICEDWTSVVKFKTWGMICEADDEENNQDEEETMVEVIYDGIFINLIQNAYQVNYMCKPTANKEAIFVKHRKVAMNELITKNNQGLFLTKLMYYHHSYEVPIPASVRYLSILEDLNEKDDDYQIEFELVLKDPTALQTLIRRLIFKTDWTATLPKLINLRELELWKYNKNLLISILRSCTSLSKLTLCSPDSAEFRNIVLDIESVSLKYLTIIGGSDTFEDILKPFPSLNSLTLERHSKESILKSNVNAIKGLQYFKLCMIGNKEVAVHLSTLQFPHMLFVISSGLHFYSASKGFELVNELSRQVSKKNIPKASGSSVLFVCNVPHNGVSLVFTKNIATRFLRNSGDLVVTVQNFIDKLQSAKYN